MRGSAAGATILSRFLQRSESQGARDLDQPRLDSADRRTRQDQGRPEARDRNDGDFQTVAEAERDESDRDHRHRGDRPQEFERQFEQAVEGAQRAQCKAEAEAEAGADEKSAEGADQRVARSDQERTVLDSADESGEDFRRRRDGIARTARPRADLSQDEQNEREDEGLQRFHAPVPDSLA